MNAATNPSARAAEVDGNRRGAAASGATLPRATTTRWPARGAALALSLLATAPAAAQVAPSSSATISASSLASPAPWLMQWSPLAPIGDLGRGGVAAPRLPDVLTTAAPRIGQFWTAGNPGAIALEMDSTSRAEFRGGTARVSGTYRRPLDPADLSSNALSAFAWQRLGAHGAAIGRASLDQQNAGAEGTAALMLDPYSNSPLVPTDTTSPELSRASLVLEGAIGWTVRGWGAGVSVGYDARDNRAAHARLGRVGRAALPALALGVSRALPGGVVVGAYGRANGRAERLTTVPMTSLEYVYQLEGYDEVEPLNIGKPPYYRRVTDDARGAGATLGATLLGARLVAFGEFGRRHQDQSSAQQQNAPTDRWRVGAVTAGAAAQRTFAGVVLATAQFRYSSLGGDASRSDLTGRIFHADDRAARTDVELRVPLGAGPWGLGGAIGGATTYSDYVHRDPVAGIGTATTAWAPEGSIELAHALSGNTALSAGYAVASYVPTSSLPPGETLGPLFQRLIGPELEYYATPTLAQSAQATVRWRAPGHTRVWLRGALQRVTPTGGDPTPLRPDGARTLVRATLGATLGG